jgi:hypothetical protein
MEGGGPKAPAGTDGRLIDVLGSRPQKPNDPLSSAGTIQTIATTATQIRNITRTTTHEMMEPGRL